MWIPNKKFKNAPAYAERFEVGDEVTCVTHSYRSLTCGKTYVVTDTLSGNQGQLIRVSGQPAPQIAFRANSFKLKTLKEKNMSVINSAINKNAERIVVVNNQIRFTISGGATNASGDPVLFSIVSSNTSEVGLTEEDIRAKIANIIQKDPASIVKIFEHTATAKAIPIDVDWQEVKK